MWNEYSRKPDIFSPSVILRTTSDQDTSLDHFISFFLLATGFLEWQTAVDVLYITPVFCWNYSIKAAIVQELHVLLIA